MTQRAGNKYAGKAAPQAVLDFHGFGILTEQDICSTAREFVFESREQGHRMILIVTGKGLHSERGGVIGPTLRRYLPTLPCVSSVLTARRDRGGEGAIEVVLC